ncbi:Uncharacterised protein [uncultured archaeon]|nr:Uncharacterised protein [uncultured archaeon]
MKFSRLTIENFSHSEKGRRVWVASCDCGNETEAREDKLLLGRKKSCGCLQRENNDRQREERIERLTRRNEAIQVERDKAKRIRTREKLSGTKTGSLGAKHAVLRDVMRNHRVPETDPLWSINFYEGLLSEDECHYCGSVLDKKGTSLDFIEGMVVTAYNSVPACIRCMELRGRLEFTFEEMNTIAPALELIRLKREGHNEHRNDSQPRP